MTVRKFKVFIAIAFISIFVAKMVISIAPVFSGELDNKFMNAVIMQLENEHHGEDGKSSIKYADHKAYFERTELTYVSEDIDYGVTNSFIEHSRRYVDPYHPQVPTPPPNFS
ncbi:hypothetical protein [Pedobacter montanisoli]|uniref:Uncharacterized protein n=1 Tax=Pedobacter montanisoli TaxID=2923277 RepID=A0ABS9ZWE0_9SPHI|nr:hypothetical protein [Pedobacter montanisoli]MCJ0742619.1 hypothetical protein [Pedobacter montanisoli]